MKKGIFFSAMSALMLAVLLLTISVSTLPRKQESVHVRVLSLNSLVKSVEADMDRGLYITSFRAILGIEQYLAQEGTYVTDYETAFSEALLNGTVEGKNITLIENSTLTDWIQSVRLKALEADVDLVANISSIAIYQTDPWSVRVMANMTLRMDDRKKAASWLREEVVESSIPIPGLEDPLYLIGTAGKVPNIINTTPFEGSYVSGFDTTNLMSHANYSLYTNGTGPSFLMRLEGNLSSSSFGMESLVYLPDLQSQGIPQLQKSVVDYLYFSNLTPVSYRVNGTPPWFYMDDAHSVKYQVNNLLI